MVGEGVDPAFARAITITVWNGGDAKVTVEYWGFTFCNRLGLPIRLGSGGPTGIGMNSVHMRKGDVPQTLDPGGGSYTFAMPLSEIRNIVKAPTRLRGYVIVGHTPRRIRSWRSVPVSSFGVVKEVPRR